MLPLASFAFYLCGLSFAEPEKLERLEKQEKQDRPDRSEKLDRPFSFEPSSFNLQSAIYNLKSNTSPGSLMEEATAFYP